MRCASLAFLLALAACQPRAATSDNGGDSGDGGARAQASPPDTPLRPATTKPDAATGAWSGEGGQILFTDATTSKPAMRIACSGGTLLVELPGVSPIGSEERLSFGGGGEVEALVVATTRKGPVRAMGAAPDRTRLATLLAAGPGASYGATAIGPLVPVPQDLTEKLLARCS